MSTPNPDTSRPDQDNRTQLQNGPPPTMEFGNDNTNPTFGPLTSGGGVPGYPFLSPPEAPDELGRLGEYRILKKLGEGGMGFVFRGEDPGLKRFIALKVMRPEVAVKPQAAERFLREGRAAAGLKSDHIITIYQVGQANGVPFLAMEFLEGLPLDEWIKSQKKAVPLSQVLRVIRDTLRGLATAHEKGLIHRDIKPANLWIEKGTSRIKILDFGLTRGTDADMQLTQEGAVVGTPAYMAPEQASGKPVDPRADLFSIGTVMYQMLAGMNPFVRGNLLETLGAVGFDTQPPVTTVRPDVPKEYSDFLDRLLAKNPDGRPANAKAALQELVAVEKKLQDVTKPVLPMMVAIPVTGDTPPVWGELTEDEGDSVRTKKSDQTRSWEGAENAAPRKPWRKWPLVALGLLVVGLAVLIPQIISIATPKGTLVIESSDPDVEVTVKKDGAVIVDKSKQREFTLKVADNYQIEMVEKDGLKLSTDKFEIAKGGRAVVKVRVEKPKEVAKPMPVAVVPVESGTFLEVHGVKKEDLEAWAAKLPKGYHPWWIAARTGTKVPTFDAIAKPVPDIVGSKLVNWTNADREVYEELKKSHRLHGEAPYFLDDVYHSLILGVQDGRTWNIWYGSAELIQEKVAEGLMSEQVVAGRKERWQPISLTAIGYQDGTFTYSLMSGWLPDRQLEWYPSLDPKDLAEKVAEYRKKGWRPHLLNPLHKPDSATKFLAVFVENATGEAWEFTPNLTVAEYEKQLVERKAKEQVPRCVCSHVDKDRVGYTVVWD